MRNQTHAFLLDKLILPVIILVLGFMGTWVFNMDSRVAVMERSMHQVETLATDQRTADRVIILLEAQTRANTELVKEMRESQSRLTEAVNEMKIVLATCCSKPDDRYGQFGKAR